MWMGGYDGMVIYRSLGDRNTAIVLLVRSVGSQKRRRTENIEINFREIDFVMRISLGRFRIYDRDLVFAELLNLRVIRLKSCCEKT